MLFHKTHIINDDHGDDDDDSDNDNNNNNTMCYSPWKSHWRQTPKPITNR